MASGKGKDRVWCSVWDYMLRMAVAGEIGLSCSDAFSVLQLCHVLSIHLDVAQSIENDLQILPQQRKTNTRNRAERLMVSSRTVSPKSR